VCGVCMCVWCVYGVCVCVCVYSVYGMFILGMKNVHHIRLHVQKQLRLIKQRLGCCCFGAVEVAVCEEF